MKLLSTCSSVRGRSLLHSGPSLSFIQQIRAFHLWAGTNGGPWDLEAEDSHGCHQEVLAVRGTCRPGVGPLPGGSIPARTQEGPPCAFSAYPWLRVAAGKVVLS